MLVRLRCTDIQDANLSMIEVQYIFVKLSGHPYRAARLYFINLNRLLGDKNVRTDQRF